MYSILFVCQANRFRSPLAEKLFLLHLISDNQDQMWHVGSAGTWTSDGLPATKDAINIAKQWGLDLTEHQSRCINQHIIAQFDLTIVMENGQKEALTSEFPILEGKVVLLSEAAGKKAYDIPDPYLKNEKPEFIANEIRMLIDPAYDKIVTWVNTPDPNRNEYKWNNS